MNLIVTSRMMAMAALIASSLLAGCGLPCTSPSTETFTVYEDAPKISQLDLGPLGNSPGDVYHFFAPLHSSAGGPVTDEVAGTKTVVKLATDARPNLERRATLLFFTFGEQQDQIIAWAFASIRRTSLNLKRASLSCARFWAEPESTWARVAR
jgi:hypothetical protein